MKLLALGLVLGCLSVADAAIQVDQVDVFIGGTRGHACYRVPTAVTLPNNTVLMAVESRRTTCGDQAPKDIELVRSQDGGFTWSEPVMLVGSLTGNTTYRNPYLTVVPGSSTTATPDLVLLQFVNSTLDEPWTTFQMESRDAGLTWSSAQPVNLSAWNGTLAGPGLGITLAHTHPGRIIMCGASGYHAGHSANGVVWFSDDQGASYVVSAVFPEMQECQVAELADGTLLINFRNSHLNSSCDCRAQSVSHDGGLTWGPLTYIPDLIEPVCSAGLVAANDTLYFTNPNSRDQRINMSVQSSMDGGNTWSHEVTLWPGPSGYSVATNHPNSKCTLGVAYERGEQSYAERITFAHINLCYE
ncbi:uncharacterized protein MONBRDRAFT_22854 [Monosiga brevicollis MX1]|uniref:Sialidase-1 n=1 Tax=Monosiga brevicollis TaxID=81824 RepID=A9US97_MONBE|nr:uncharacterized protein MONBRDRAFT_22854 [Monosiga brevicollis MX1]EDQ92063.1 predicted protein [Monosiga brevicollis MX1]|eukprot:XP_001743349.1 hypothetical protein [Monosiga brevicollis MX1]